MLVVYSTKLVTLPAVETLPLPAVDPTIPEPEVVTTGLAVVPTIGGLLLFGWDPVPLSIMSACNVVENRTIASLLDRDLSNLSDSSV